MIAVERRGRLGNRLFQLAFGIAAASRLGTSLAVPEDDDVRRIFTLGEHGRPIRRRLGVLRFRAAHRLRPYRVVREDPETSAEALLAGLRDRTLYDGYFQSERYFAHARGEVLAAFAFRPAHEDRLRARYADLLERPYVCCHVRRTDYHAWEEGGVVLPGSYYLDALDVLAPTAGTPIVFVGDDFEDLQQELGHLPGARFERNDEALDLLLVARAGSVVTSNSSFGWWGAYLNRSAAAVVAPRHWLGFKRGREVPRDVVPLGWRQLAVRQPKGAVR